MKILFMCVANSARSQLAEGLAKSIFPNDEIESAGSNPGRLNLTAVAAMKEIDLDISGHHSKSFSDLPKDFTDNLDYVITLCAEEVCPIIATKAKKLHWPFPDPATKTLVADPRAIFRFREARDAIKERLLEFKAEIQK